MQVGLVDNWYFDHPVNYVGCIMANWPKNKENVQIFQSSCFYVVVLPLDAYVVVQTQYFFVSCASNLNCSACSHVGSLFTDEEQKKMACGVFDTLAAHATLVYSVTDTDSWSPNGVTRGHVFMTFKHQFLTNGGKKLSKNINNNCCAHTFCSFAVDRVCGASSVGFPLVPIRFSLIYSWGSERMTTMSGWLPLKVRYVFLFCTGSRDSLSKRQVNMCSNQCSAPVSIKTNKRLEVQHPWE